MEDQYEHHPHLFREVRHLKPDYFISGDPDKPDPEDEGWHKYEYYNELDVLRGTIKRLSNGK